MIEIKEKEKCCGCTACLQICPKNCIKMEYDAEGFFYPIVDKEQCISCGRCERVCPISNVEETRNPIEVLAAYNLNMEERLNSSSGGIFSLFAKYVLKQDGVVFGAMYSSQWDIVHGCIEDIKSLSLLQGSKYVQSDISHSYVRAAEYLKEGRMVLFSGTPCQIAGLRKYLNNKEFDNLYLLDVLCHGVPSPGVWKQYLKEEISEYNKTAQRAVAGKSTVLHSLNFTSPIRDVKFREKGIGWKKYRFVLRFAKASAAGEKSSVLSSVVYQHPFLRGMLEHLFIRPSCYHCPFRCQRSHSNVSLGDFWGIEKQDSRFGDDKGTSMVLINDEKGKMLWDQVSDDTFSATKTYEQAKAVCSMITQPCHYNPCRESFFNDLSRGKTVKYSVWHNVNIPLKKRIKNWLRRFQPNRILVDAPGQTCNRFWAYLDSVAWALVNKKKVIIWFWDPSIKYYDALRNNPYVVFPFYRPWLFKLISEKNVKLLVGKILCNRPLRDWFYKTKMAKLLGCTQSWELRKSYQYFPAVKDEMKKLFRPNEDICKTVESTMSLYRREGFFIIGVHIRRGDYVKFEGGKYFFDFDEYRDIMAHLVSIYNNKKIAFFISTNEKYDPKIFEDFTICETKNSTAAHDLYTLSLCDRIVGPLSTFSRWASWYGNVPLAFVERNQRNLNDSSFSVISDFYHFINGCEIPNLTDK